MEHARLGLWCGIHTVDMLISIDFRLSFFQIIKMGWIHLIWSMCSGKLYVILYVLKLYKRRLEIYLFVNPNEKGSNKLLVEAYAAHLAVL